MPGGGSMPGGIGGMGIGGNPGGTMPGGLSNYGLIETMLVRKMTYSMGIPDIGGKGGAPGNPGGGTK